MKRLILLCTLLLLLSTTVLADANQTFNSTNITNSTPLTNVSKLYFNKIPLHIQNGQCVPINATVDISSLGWGVSDLAYYNRWMNDFSPLNSTPSYLLPIPNTYTALYNYWVDPSIFGNKTGFWYQHYDNNAMETAGNLRAFFVNQSCPEPIVKNITVSLELTNQTTPEKLPSLTNNYVSDVLIARGDTISIPVDHGNKWWLFGYGKTNMIPDKEIVDSNITLSPSNMDGMSIGNYHLDIVDSGNNGLLEENYDPVYKSSTLNSYTYPAIVSPLREVSPINIKGLDPQLVEQQLNTAVKNSRDDSVSTMNVAYQEPSIQISRVDALQNPTNDTYYDIRGYTNEIAGTPLTITIDIAKLNSKTQEIRQFSTIVNGTDIGSMRQFNELIPINYNLIGPGDHTITVSSEDATTTVDIYIHNEPPNSYVPPQYTEYLGTSPYVTPKIVTQIQTVIVTMPPVISTVVVHDTPSQEQVNAAFMNGVTTTIEDIIITLIGVGIIAYGIIVVYRGRKK